MTNLTVPQILGVLLLLISIALLPSIWLTWYWVGEAEKSLVSAFYLTFVLGVVCYFPFPRRKKISCIDIDAPFGLTWGRSQKAYEKMYTKALLEGHMTGGFHCGTINDEGDGLVAVCTAHEVPKQISFADDYQLYFHKTKGLMRVSAIGYFTDNKTKYKEEKKAYKQVCANLVTKYGRCNYFFILSRKVWHGKSGGKIELISSITPKKEYYLKLTYDSPKLPAIDPKKIAERKKKIEQEKEKERKEDKKMRHANEMDAL